MPCSQCIYGYTTLSDGSCFACGSTAATYGCATCSKNKTCTECVPGMVLQKNGSCIAETINNKNSVGFYIVVIVALSVTTAGLIGLAIYWHVTRREQASLYSQIS